MKLLLALLLLASTHVDPLKTEDKTRRMAQIEAKYNVEIVGILRTSGRADYWIFMESQPTTTFGRVPIVIPKDGTDHDMEIARTAAENCAAYYDSEIRRAKPTPTPVSAFTVPTRPAGEVER
jgi:hypothetical protein